MMKRKHVLHLIGFTVILLAAIEASRFSIAAQGPYQWSPVEQVPGYLDDTFPPYLVADQNQTVHALTSQWVSEEDHQKAVVYSKWSLAGGWTYPVDILLSPYKSWARIFGAFLDPAGIIHVVFVGGDDFDANIYYSQAPAGLAGRATAWSQPQLVGEDASAPVYAALAGDDKGNLVIIYHGDIDGGGVYALQSSDAGDSWSEPAPIFLTYDPERWPFSLYMHMGQAGQLHAVWDVRNPQGNAVSSHYARLDVERHQWSEPIVLADKSDVEDEGFGPGFPVPIEYRGDVVVMYNSGIPPSGVPPSVWVRVSKDAGQTWSGPIRPMPRHVGLSGLHSLVVDSNDVVHALAVLRIPTTAADGTNMAVGGLWHGRLHDEGWNEPERLDTGFAAHDVRAVISQGNVLLVTFREDPGAGDRGVWYSYTTLNAPELPVLPLQTPSPTPTVLPTPAATLPAPAATPLHRPTSISQEELPEAATTNPAIPLMLGVGPVLLVVAGVIVIHQLNHRRRS